MFTVVSLTNPVYGNAEGTHINCQIQFAEFPGEIHNFGANEWDPEPHGQQIYADLKAGKYGVIGPYVSDEAEVAAIIRDQRNRILATTDWSQGVDVPSAIKNKWAVYRQALRDVPQQSGFPSTVNWPVSPG